MRHNGWLALVFSVGVAASAAAEPVRLAGTTCEMPPLLHCPEANCAGDVVTNGGPAVETKTGRNYFLDYPCDLKKGEKVTFILALHGAGSYGNWQRHYFPIVDYKDKYRLVIATPFSPRRVWGAEDDAYLQNIVTTVIAELGAKNVKAFWLVGHSQGGMTSNRIVRTDFFKTRVDGWLSLSGGRLGGNPGRGDFSTLFRGAPPAGGRAGAPGAAPAGGRGGAPGGLPPAPTALPDTEFSFIYESGQLEADEKGIPETSQWATQLACGARKRSGEIVDTKAGYVYDRTRQDPPTPAWGLLPRPGKAVVFDYPKCKGGRVVADVVRLDKGHTEGLEPKVTEALVKMIVAAPGGKVASLALPQPNRPPAAAAACTSATEGCTEWVTLAGGPARSLIYRTRPLDVRNDNVRRALIMVHGTNRNADHYFTTATAAAFLAGALEDSVVISPRIASAAGSCHDVLAPNEVSWSCTGDSWRSGGDAVSHPNLTSFEFIDQILKKLANKSVFPNLRGIVVAGHSAGGQVVARYQMANRVHETLGVPVTYVVANPSSYAWPDATRPLPVDDAATDAAKGAWETENVHTKFSYGAFDASKCANYNRWPAGLTERTSGYTAKMTDEQLKQQMVSRPTTFLFGQVDTLPLGGFDSSCPAMAQGATRRARGEAYVKYINEKFGAKHAVQIVSECGHNDRCVYTTDKVLPVIFPK